LNTYITIRWYVNLIDNLALSTYAGYPGRKDYIMSYLKSAATSLEMLSKGLGTLPTFLYDLTQVRTVSAGIRQETAPPRPHGRGAPPG